MAESSAVPIRDITFRIELRGIPLGTDVPQKIDSAIKAAVLRALQEEQLGPLHQQDIEDGGTPSHPPVRSDAETRGMRLSPHSLASE